MESKAQRANKICLKLHIQLVAYLNFEHQT